MATNILMPALSPTMEEGKLARWLVKEGDTVKSGTILAEIETDKATMEFEAVDEGKIGKILVPEGSEGVKVNAPIAMLLDEGEKAERVDIPAAMKHRRQGRSAEAAAAPQAEAPKAEAPKAAAATAAARSRCPPRPPVTASASSPRRWPAASPPRRASILPPCPAPARAAASSSR